MAFEITPNAGDRGDDRATSEAVAGTEARVEHRLLRDGRQVIASGALICSRCELPLPGRPAVAAAQILHCGWCGHAAPARELLRAGVFDTAQNRVELVARYSA